MKGRGLLASRRRVVLLGVIVAGAGAALLALMTSRHRPPAHIVLVVVDTLRRDHVAAYGGSVQTPGIEELVSGGTTFTHVVGSYHQTTMSMAALFTGRTPSIESTHPGEALPWQGHTWCGLSRFARGGDDACIPSGVPTLAEALHDAGYRTAGIVSNPFLFRPAGYDRGFDDWVEVGGDENPSALGRIKDRYGVTRRAGIEVNRAVRAWLAARSADRFFLYVHYMDAHDWKLRGISYGAAVHMADAAVRDLRHALAEANVLDDTVIVFTADHGEGLGEPHALPAMPTHMGNPSFEPVLDIPLIVWPPVAADMARFMRTDDTSRLIRTLAGVAPTPPADLADDELFLTERFYRTYRRGPWKSMWPRGQGAVYLFDLEHDPNETENVADSHHDEVEAHRRRIDELSVALAAASTTDRALSPEERERLRSLGYIQ